MKHNGLINRWLLVVAAVLLTLALLPGGILAENLKTDSRMPHLHDIPLRDASETPIKLPDPFDAQGKPQEAAAIPYSVTGTCGKCHEYNTISKGWHFNAAQGNVPAGRPGEPWLLTDNATHTQIPLSYRGWKGTFKPADIGMKDFDFVATFGRHMPGGGVGDPSQIDTKDARNRRFAVSGPMQIDCMICHDASGHYNHEARYMAMNAENYKWAPTIGAGLGVFGSTKTAKTFANSWRPPKPAPTTLPSIKYNRARFDVEDNVAFQVTRRPSADNCYYCHTSDTRVGDARWHSDRDVHIRAGMACVDCHRSGVDHMIVRGYENEQKDRPITPEMVEMRVKTIARDNPGMNKADAAKQAREQLTGEQSLAGALSCRGCHLGVEGATQPTAAMGGRLGAPVPKHIGLPPIHLEKLSCTACHSGPLPSGQTQIVHTSLAHKLGLPGPMRADNTPPVIVEPVFIRGTDGKIAPNKMVWPSYWGRLAKDGKITPILPAEAAEATSGILPDPTAEDPYCSAPLSDEQITKVLTALSADPSNGEAIFIAAGKMYRLKDGKLASAENEAAKPYAWPLAHDVRPASEALGAKACTDCHAADSPIYFGTVLARGPVAPSAGVSKTMLDLRGDNRLLASIFAFMFVLRPMLKYICFGAAIVVLGVLVYYGLLALGAITSRARRQQASNESTQLS